jgi:hypothetical protein
MGSLIQLKNVRLSFEHVFRPTAYENNDLKFSASLLIDKKDKANLDLMRKAILDAACMENGWGSKGQVKVTSLTQQNRTCLHDGNTKDYEGYENCFFVSASTPKRPTVVDADRTPLTEADGKVYSGCFVNAWVQVWAQKRYGERINAELIGIQFVRDGEAFSGGAKAMSPEDFDDLTVEEDPF